MVQFAHLRVHDCAFEKSTFTEAASSHAFVSSIICRVASTSERLVLGTSKQHPPHISTTLTQFLRCSKCTLVLHHTHQAALLPQRVEHLGTGTCTG